MATPVPVANYGRDAKVSEAVREKLMPDYDIVHTCLDLEHAESELPALFDGNLEIASASGLGSNLSRPAGERLVPKVVFFGGDIPDGDVSKITDLIKAKAAGTTFVRVSKMDVLKAGGLGPNPDVIAKVYRKKMSKEGM